MYPITLYGPLATAPALQWEVLVTQLKKFKELELSVRTDMPKFGPEHDQAVAELAALIRAKIAAHLGYDPVVDRHSCSAGLNAVVRYHIRLW